MDKLTIHVNAKINLTLDVCGRRSDGFHALDMCMASISLGDTMTCEPSEGISVIMDGKECGEWNIAYKAIAACRERGIIKGMAVEISKNIPISSGLGGSSADCAGVLYAARKFANCQEDELLDIANSLGSDVSFMLRGGVARVGGKGECVTSLSYKEYYAVIAMGEHGALTKDVFAEYDKDIDIPTCYTRTLVENWDTLGVSCVGNGLEGAARIVNPEIGETLDIMTRYSRKVAMSGSGAGVFGIFENRVEAEKACQKIKKQVKFAVVTRLEPCGIVEK